MPAPTAIVKSPEVVAKSQPSNTLVPEQGDDLLIDPTQLVLDEACHAEPTQALNEQSVMHIDEEGRPLFTPTVDVNGVRRVETRKIPIPPHRMSPLKAAWPKIYPPLVEALKLQVRMNIKNRAVELRTSRATDSDSALQKGEDFIRAFTLGFAPEDAVAIIRLDDIYIRSFEIKDVKASLNGEHLSRAIGRIAGKDGKTKWAIENASRTRVVLADSKVHILGTFKALGIAQEAIVSLILGSPPGKVYGNLRTVASRMKERF